MIILHLDCFEQNKKLKGFWLYSYDDVKDASECQEQYCQQSTQCTAFVYNTKTRECTLKKVPVVLNGLGNLKLQHEDGKVFGPKYCTGSYIRNYILIY